MCWAASTPSASSTALVISSTNSGMPSVRSTMSCRRLTGKRLLPATRSIRASISRRDRRLIVRAVTFGRPIHGGSNSGRNVTINSTRRSAIWSQRPTKRFQARRICPMRIFEDHQDRIFAFQRFHLRNERFQRSLPSLRRGQIECRIASVVRKRKHLGEQRGVLDRSRGLREHRIELVELRLWRIVVHKTRRRVPFGQ